MLGPWGADPTVTDASLLLGYLGEDSFAGGIRLDRQAGERALDDLAAALGMERARAGLGIHTVANAAMAEAFRMLTVRRGLDPRGFALVLLGGAGPVHGGAVAALLSIRTLIVPARPGVLAAEGLLEARTEFDAYRTFDVRADEADVGAMQQAFDELETLGRDKLAMDGIPLEAMTVWRSADMRYIGQSYDLEVALPEVAGVAAAVEAFRAAYRRLYGHGSLEDAVEFVNLRVLVTSAAEAPRRLGIALSAPSNEMKPGQRPVCFEAEEGFIDTPVLARAGLAEGTRIIGPAIITQPDTTTVLYPGQCLRVDPLGKSDHHPAGARMMLGPCPEQSSLIAVRRV